LKEIFIFIILEKVIFSRNCIKPDEKKNTNVGAIRSCHHNHNCLISNWNILLSLDSDTIMQKDWITKIYTSFHAIKNDYPENQIVLCSGFNTETERHRIIEKKSQYILKNSVG